MSKLKDLSINITDGEHGTVKDDINGDYYLLSNKNIIDNNIFIGENERKINKTTFDKINKRTKLEIGDVVISTVGTIGKTAVIEDDNINYVFQRSVGIIKVDKNKLNPYYLKYQLDSKEFQKRMIKLSKGAVQKCLYISDLEELEIKVIDLEKQNEIVNKLKTIDDKIKNNLKIIYELEELTKTVYNYWFLQCNFPDKNGKPYKSTGGIMIKNNEILKEIPQNWSVKKLRDCIEHINTGLNPRKNFVFSDGNIRYITVKNLTTHGNIDFENCDYIDEAARDIVHNRSKIQKGDILFASIAPLGRCHLIMENPKDWDINESVFSIRVNNLIIPEYLYLYLTSEEFIKMAQNSSTGSIFKGIRINALLDMNIVLPDQTILTAFRKNIEPIFILKDAKINEIEELKKLKNFLLPLLINEQIL